MQYAIERPEIVERALSLARDLGFDVRPEGNQPDSDAAPSCCIDAVGSFLRTLCSSLESAHVGEIGTGAGVGTAWLASGLRSSTRITSVEIEPHLAQAAAKLFEGLPVNVINQDWRGEFKRCGPYDLLFADGGGVGGTSTSGWEEVADLVRLGGFVVIDDLTPEELWPESWQGKPDAKRELAFRSGYFASTEVRTSHRTSALLMVRL